MDFDQEGRMYGMMIRSERPRFQGRSERTTSQARSPPIKILSTETEIPISSEWESGFHSMEVLTSLKSRRFQ